MAKRAPVSKKEKLLTFRYQASTVEGKAVKGTLKAESEIAAQRLIIDKGYNPINVEIAPSMFALEEALPSLFKIKPQDVIIFSRQLSTLLKSGISLLPALEILQGQVSTSRAFKKILTSVINDIGAGHSFSEAISKHPLAFGDIYFKTIAVGEQTGNMETVLNRMAEYLEKQNVMSKKIGKALTYPSMVLVVGVVVIVVLMTSVMPQLLGMFTAMKVELPLPTKILIAAPGFFTGGSQLYLLIALSFSAALILYLVKQPSGRRLLDQLRLHAPLIGPVTHMGELARLSRIISISVSAGVNLQEIMELVPHSTNNTVFQHALKQVNEGFLLGEGLAAPMQRIPLFPPLLVQMVAVGEESNTLDFTMGVVADFYETATEEKIEALVGMIGPLSTIGIALMVGFIAIAVIMPIYQLTGAFD